MAKASHVTQSRSLPYEDFSKLVRGERLNVKKDIDSIYRYIEDEAEKFFYHETLRTDGGMTCYNSRVGNSAEFPTSKEFDWNKENLARISKHFTPKTNFYIVMGDGTSRNRSQITKDQFMNWSRDDIEVGFKQVKVDIQDLAKQIAAATRSS